MRNSILGLSSNQLKIIAVITMTIDHIGLYLFPSNLVLRMIGRIAFPIFAFTFAEGCKYTKNRTRHLLVLAAVALLCQVVYTYTMKSYYQNILVTLSLSAILIYAYDFAKKTDSFLGYAVAILALLWAFYICFYLPPIIGKGFDIDYGFYGVILPLLVYAGKTKQEKVFLLTLGLLLLAPTVGEIQLYSLLSVPLIALYSGRRGKWRMKYFFYVFYPIHLVIIYMIGKFLA